MDEINALAKEDKIELEARLLNCTLPKLAVKVKVKEIFAKKEDNLARERIDQVGDGCGRGLVPLPW